MAGRGRGRGAPGGLKGVTWDYDPNMKLDSKPTDLYPPHPNLRRGAPFTATESRQIQYYLNLQEQIHRGPLYTQASRRDIHAPAKAFSEDQVNSQYASNRKSDIDPFVGVGTYSMRYAPKTNELPKLSDRPFNKQMFPKELWPTLEGEDMAVGRSQYKRPTAPKTLILSDRSAVNRDKDKSQVVLDKIHSLGVESDDGEEDGEDGEAEVDEEFDDDEIGGDYDAEQYFDGGEGDSDGDGGGGADDAY
ncbi:BgTH12-04647 [Blumeria graminis f. sp. triticale]|uniref:DNA-directed RNA polymerase III subunit n=3 Tax=Blumeria graminis TaxID=34373 RepID=A0A061HD52_BLUGR|nr:hypothetical protein BGT96224_3605 [Blumeria graminis f. sp. tritici 96224]CAD6498993.1 BgTH12-04647 [Blumeria graminis f. sp. triticale]VCU39124.1 Bgt-3605 [Blumeria graminis f. sp. tritici]